MSSAMRVSTSPWGCTHGKPISSRRPLGAGSASRSTLPLPVSGNVSSTTKADGTMYSGSSWAKKARQVATAGAGTSVCT